MISMNVTSHDNQAKTVFVKAELKFFIMPDKTNKYSKK